MNALAIFQHIMNDIFRKFLNNCVVIYLDDILVFSNNSKEHKKTSTFCLQKTSREKGMQKWRNVLVKQRSQLGYIIFNSGLSIYQENSDHHQFANHIFNSQINFIWICICLLDFYQKLLKEYCPFHTT